jgi:hypothetical protein
MKELCMYCGDEIIGVQHGSLLFGAPTSYFLCEHCSSIEYAQEEKNGTNNVPNLVQAYWKNIRDRNKK